MALTETNTEDRLVQQTFADYLRDRLGWESVYAFHTETFGASGTLGRRSERDVVLWPHLEQAVARLNPLVPSVARQQAIERITTVEHSRSLLQHNREFYRLIRDGIPVSWRDEAGAQQQARVQVIDFRKDHVSCVFRSKRPPNPIQFGQAFWFNSATASGPFRPGVTAG
ncbi:type I restriction endonuclease, partial [Gemmatimonas sp.]|uniref:type I restriction endonuclease n=1 Tax=Gemmatimonas sp. TaxID=1962908 RepID=UPI0037C12E95